jgi:AcrR family transcriptional regulator
MARRSNNHSYERIREAALDLFARQGYVATGIRDIAREAGITSSTLYHHVANKEELLVAIMREAFEMLATQAREALEGRTSPEEKLAALVRRHVMTEIVERRLANVIAVEFRFLGPDARDEVVPLRDAYERIWDEVIEAGIRKRAFRVRDPQMARLGILQMCGGPGQWYRADGPSSPEQIADAFAAMALAVVGAEAPASTSS